jgi:tRNA(Ile)-lysidine synthase TilS/MesJ
MLFCAQAEFVRGWSERYGLEVFLENAPPEVFNASSSFQEIARNYRRDVSTRLAQQCFASGPALICVAHHLDDEMETLMLKLLRGVHISNFVAVSS